MAIVVQCFQCSTVLELDDGFRGGVARCSNCGALLRVPKEAGAAEDAGRPHNPAMPQPRPRSGSDPGISSGGLKAAGAQRRPSDYSASSGAFSRSPRPRIPPVPQPGSRPGQVHTGSETIPGSTGYPPLKSNKLLYILGIFFIGVIFSIAIIVIVHELSPKVLIPSPQNTQARGTPVPNINGPQFLGIPLAGSHIIFAIDGSSANADTYSLVVQNIEYAVKHGKSPQHFRVLIWNTGNGLLVPNHSWIRRSTSADQWAPVVNYLPVGDSDPFKAIFHSINVGGTDQVVLVTARKDLNDELVNQVNDQQTQVHIDAISINTPSTVLAQIAYQHNGAYVQVSTTDLQNALSN
jgi:hypothetical protein